MPKISLKFNEQVLKEIPLDKPRLTIGRKPDNDLVIDNPAMSGHHALIYSDEIAPASPPPGETESAKAMLPDPAKQKELVKTVPETIKTAAAGGKTTEKVGRLTVVSGETDRKAYELTGHLTVIGAEDT